MGGIKILRFNSGPLIFKENHSLIGLCGFLLPEKKFFYNNLIPLKN